MTDFDATDSGYSEYIEAGGESFHDSWINSNDTPDEFPVQAVASARRELETNAWPRSAYLSGSSLRAGGPVSEFQIINESRIEGTAKRAFQSSWVRSAFSIVDRYQRVPLRTVAGTELPSQPTLDLEQFFAPTPGLVAFWIEGAAAYAAQANSDALPQPLKVDHVAQHEFAQLVQSVIGKIGQQLRYERSPETTLIVGQRFSLRAQGEFCDRITIVPDRTTPFLTQLASEITSAVRQGVIIGGTWGRLINAGSDQVRFNLSSAERRKDSSFKRAKTGL